MKSKEKKRIKFLYHISILTNKEIKLYDWVKIIALENSILF